MLHNKISFNLVNSLIQYYQERKFLQHMHKMEYYAAKKEQVSVSYNNIDEPQIHYAK